MSEFLIRQGEGGGAKLSSVRANPVVRFFRTTQVGVWVRRGHNIPEPVIRRRFSAGKANFERHYRAAVDAWVLYDNSGDEPVMTEWGER